MVAVTVVELCWNEHLLGMLSSHFIGLNIRLIIFLEQV